MSANGATPRVSVVVPVFNPGSLLRDALDSVAAQTYRDLETIVVDDGSTDATTLAILDEAERRPATTVIHTPNRGPAAARNTAIERSRGAYILPLDADDTLAPTFLARTTAVLDAEPAVGICFTWVGLTGGHHGVWRTGEFSAEALLGRCTLHVTSLYRRALWHEVGGYDPAFVEGSEDWDFWLGAAERGWTARGIAEVLMSYRRSATSRERRARGRAASAQIMRRLVAKHRALYEAHLEDALAGLYVEYATVASALERAYNNPAGRMLTWLRARWPRRDASSSS
jgi:glycosyltransferase involved in cell wall biosynthesis